MTATESQYGTVINMNDVQDKKSGQVAVSTSLPIGLVYQDGANGWKVVPVSSIPRATRMYWNPRVLDNTDNDSLANSVSGTFYGEGSRVVGKAKDTMTPDHHVKASGAEAGQFANLNPPGNATTPTAGEVDAVRDWQEEKVAVYKGHVNEINRVDVEATNAAANETNCVFEISRG